MGVIVGESACLSSSCREKHESVGWAGDIAALRGMRKRRNDWNDRVQGDV